jgi:hypothetical protein
VVEGDGKNGKNGTYDANPLNVAEWLARIFHKMPLDPKLCLGSRLGGNAQRGSANNIVAER